MQWWSYYLQCVRSGDETGKQGNFHSGVRRFPREDPVTQFNFDAGQPVGYFNTEQSAHKGLTARLWKTVTVDGTVQSDEVFNNSKYKSSPKIVTVGTAGASAEVVAQLQAAAAANDEGSVKSIAASAAATVHRQHRLRHRTQMRQGRHRPTDPNAAGQITGHAEAADRRMQQGRHRDPDTAAGRTDAVNARR